MVVPSRVDRRRTTRARATHAPAGSSDGRHAGLHRRCYDDGDAQAAGVSHLPGVEGCPYSFSHARPAQKSAWAAGGSVESSSSMDEDNVPLGTDFLELVRAFEESCEARTDEVLPRLGKRAPKTYSQLGTVLSLLDRLGSCYWGCGGGDHAIEWLAARASSNSRGALRLMRAGFYDEALGLARSVGEVCNLLHLFVFERTSLDDWRTTDPATRRKRYSALTVRMRLERVADRAIIQNDRYSVLSGFAAHPDPASPPQAHNILGVASTGGGVFPGSWDADVFERARAGR